MRAEYLTGELHSKDWGSENWLHNSPDLCVKILSFNEGARFSLHFHREKEEVFYILSGTVELERRDTETGEQFIDSFGPGEAILIPRLVPHRITAVTRARILEASTHHEDSDSYRVEPGDSQKG